jgi:hypothetical protein
MLGRAIFLTNLAQLEDLIVPVGLVVTFGLQQVSVPFFPLSLSLSLSLSFVLFLEPITGSTNRNKAARLSLDRQLHAPAFVLGTIFHRA